MRKLARLFGFREERAVVAQRSRRPRSISRGQVELDARQICALGRGDIRAASKGKGAGMAAGTSKLSREMQFIAMPESDRDAHKVARHSPLVPRPTESGVFVTARRAIDLDDERPSVASLADAHALEEVTLIVYGWENVQPGTLSWTFPSLRSALDAVRAMRNAVRWAVLLGEDVEAGGAQARALDDVEVAREQGRILVEA